MTPPSVSLDNRSLELKTHGPAAYFNFHFRYVSCLNLDNDLIFLPDSPRTSAFQSIVPPPIHSVAQAKNPECLQTCFFPTPCIQFISKFYQFYQNVPEFHYPFATCTAMVLHRSDLLPVLPEPLPNWSSCFHPVLSVVHYLHSSRVILHRSFYIVHLFILHCVPIIT